jgi:hypothetical protein
MDRILFVFDMNRDMVMISREDGSVEMSWGVENYVNHSPSHPSSPGGLLEGGRRLDPARHMTGRAMVSNAHPLPNLFICSLIGSACALPIFAYRCTVLDSFPFFRLAITEIVCILP